MTPDFSCALRTQDTSKYARVEELPTKDEKRVVAAVHQCQETPSTPEYSNSFPDKTGRYEGDDWFLCLNQAGLHVEAWLSKKLSRASGGVNRKVYRCSGEFDPTTGKFKLEGDRQLELFDAGSTPLALGLELADGTTDILESFSNRATLSDRALQGLLRATKGQPGSVESAVEAEHLPLGHSRTEAIAKVLLSGELRSRLQAVFLNEPSEANRVEVQKAINRVASYFQRVSSDGSLGDSSNAHWFERTFAPADRSKVRAFSRGVCHSTRWSFVTHGGGGTELTVYEWLQRLRTWDERYSTLKHSGIPFATWLGVEKEQPHRYHLNLHAVGYSIGAGIPFSKGIKKKVNGKLDEVLDKVENFPGKGQVKKGINEVLDKLDTSAGFKRLAGTLIVTHEKLGWTQAYPVDFAYAMAGDGAAFFNYNQELVAEGWCETETEWLPDHFPGDLTVFTGPGATWDSKRTKGQFVWNAGGSGPNRGTQLIFDKVESDMGSDFLGHGWGEIVPPDVETWKPPQEKQRFKTVVYTEEHHTEESFHFYLGSATVRDNARKLLRKMCANELAELRDPDSLLRVWGYADRLGRRWYNQELSESRSENTLQAIKDCVGPKVSAKTETYGAGEDGLTLLNRFMSFPDNQPTPEMRKVVIWLNASASVELKVRDKK